MVTNMEMDSWQYWDEVRDQVDRGVTGMSCLKCNYELKASSVKKRAHSGNAFRPCPKCGGEVRFYRKKK